MAEGPRSSGTGLIIGAVVVSFFAVGAVAALSAYFLQGRIADLTASKVDDSTPPQPGPAPQMGQASAAPPPTSQPGSDVAVGKPAPEIEGEDVDGKPFKLTDYKGKVVLLDFWGHW